MSTEQLTQSINFSGAQITGDFQIGQAGGDLTQTQQITHSTAAKPLTQVEVVDLIQQIEALFADASLQPEEKAEALKQLNKAKDEVQEEEPDKTFIAKSLQRATKIVQQADEAVTAGEGLWQRLEPIANNLAPWLGVAAKTLLLI
jgi:ElaB/YqjD/DUF883 family membrane-anchored ribosome-binding protein